MLRTAICDPVDSTREPLRSMLLGVDFVFLDTDCKRYDVFFEVVQDSPPELAIICLDGDKPKAVQVVAQLAHEYPRLPLLVIANDNQAILQALQAGARHFLTQPLVLEDLLRTLRKIQSEGSPQAAATSGGPAVARNSQQSQVFAILGSRGGVGCTSLAVNLAATLAADPSHNVALIDLDLALGDADVALDLLANRTLADLSQNIQDLDLNFINRTLIKHASGLSLLAHPMELGDISMIEGPHVERVLNLLRISYTHQVCDLSKGLTPIDLAALDAADSILLVAQLELSSLRNVVRMLLSLGAHEGIADKVKVIVNRVGADHLDGDISLKKAVDTIGRPIFWQIPNDAKAMLGSRIAGEPLLKHAPKSRAQQSIEGLAAALTGRPVGGESHSPPSSGGLFRGMFGKR